MAVVLPMQAYKHIKAHPLEKHLDECLKEWKMYIKMMKALNPVAGSGCELP